MTDFQTLLLHLKVRMEQIASSDENARVKADKIRIAFDEFEQTCEITGCIVPTIMAKDLKD
jgi:hypothetical protein